MPLQKKTKAKKMVHWPLLIVNHEPSQNQAKSTNPESVENASPWATQMAPPQSVTP